VIEERGLVIAAGSDGFAQVETQRSSACGSCEGKAVCGTSALSKLFGARRSSVQALNPIGARPGEQVVIGLHEGAMTRASFAFYIVPLLSLFLFAVMGEWVGTRLAIASTEPAAVAGGVLGLLLGLGWVRRYAESIRHDRRYQAVVLRRSPTISADVGVSVDFEHHRI